MGRFRNMSNDDTSDGGIDISPLIDCVFILLIFFIVTTTFVEETGVEVDRPEAASSTQLEKNSIMLAITADGDIMYAKGEIQLGGVTSLVKRLLQKEQDDIPVIVQADEKSQSGMLVRVVDAAKLGGAKNVSVATDSTS